MEQDKKINEIANCIDCIFLLTAYGHLRVLMEDAGLGLHKGVIVFVPDPYQTEEIIQSFVLCGAERGQIWGNKLPTGLNYTTKIVQCQPQYRQSAVLEFLAQTEYFPVLIVSQKIPDWLQDYSNILLVEEIDDQNYVKLDSAKSRATELQNFLDFSHRQTQMLWDFLAGVKNTVWYDQISSKRRYYVGLYCVAKAFAYYIVADNTGVELSENYHQLVHETICDASDYDYFEMNMGLIFYKNLIAYLNNNKKIFLESVDEIQGEVIKAVKKEEAILYDHDFYYMPDKIFGEIATKMDNVISKRHLKLVLLHEQVLVCNNTRSNYSIKKLLTSAYGETLRVRFLKFSREKLEEGQQLSLVERRQTYVSGKM